LRAVTPYASNSVKSLVIAITKVLAKSARSPSERVYFLTIKELSNIESPFKKLINIYKKPENSNFHLVLILIQSEKVTKSPEDVSKQPEDVSKQPEDISKQPEDISKQPEDISKQPEDVSKQPEDISKQPEDISKQPKDVSK
jgi:hypothetical protein